MARGPLVKRNGTGPNDGYNMMQARARNSRRGWVAVVVAASLFLVAFCVNAQTVTCTLWLINGPGADNLERDFGGPDVFCAAALADAAPGSTMASCTVSETAASYTVTYEGTDYSFTGARTCEADDPEDQPEVMTTAQATAALMWGFLVVCFGVGFIGGRLR